MFKLGLLVTTVTSPPAVIRPHLSLGAVVALACTAMFMVVLDTAIVNVALPSMRASLGLSASAQQWVVDIYLLTFGGLLLLAARAADLLGRRALFLGGLAVFTVASLVGGLATDGTMLLIARAVQGVGAAALAPSSLSLITASHHDPHQRTRALAIWGAAASASAAAGVVLGGVLTEALSWRWVRWVNVPIGAVLLLAAAAWLLPAAPGGRVRLDLPGAVTSTLGLGGVIFGISRAAEDGWGSATVLVSLLAGVAFLAVFVAVERRSTAPLVRLGIFREGHVLVADLVMLGLGATLTASLYFLSLYLQQLLGYTALRAGLAMLPMSVLLGAGAILSRRLMSHGVRDLPAYGAVIAAAGLLWLTRLPGHPAYASHVLGPTLLLGLGASLMVLPLTVAATAGLPHHEAGMASGLTNVARQVGGALGLAVLVTIADTARDHRISAGVPAATLHGFHVALLVTAALILACGAGALALRRPAS
jgi:EmrB/QacA subfamily drug resistance transporter